MFYGSSPSARNAQKAMPVHRPRISPRQVVDSPWGDEVLTNPAMDKRRFLSMDSCLHMTM